MLLIEHSAVPLIEFAKPQPTSCLLFVRGIKLESCLEKISLPGGRLTLLLHDASGVRIKLRFCQTHTPVPRRDVDFLLADVEDMPWLPTAPHLLECHTAMEADDLPRKAGIRAWIRSLLASDPIEDGMRIM